MEEYTHLRKEGADELEKPLLSHTASSEGVELLARMKHISKLIEEVSLILFLFSF
jgi:hypothetical protein